MRFLPTIGLVTAASLWQVGTTRAIDQAPLLRHSSTGREVSVELYADLEELARLVDISYCVGATSFGISKPFQCLSRCSDFPQFELVTTWNTGPMLSDSCGYIALDHGRHRLVVAFRGTYSITNTVVDLSTVPQEYVPYPGEAGDEKQGYATDMAKEILGAFPHLIKRDADEPRCNNCTVHMGFHNSWVHSREHILPNLQAQLAFYPNYEVSLVGHSLGGAVAALAGLDLLARGMDPTVTTFGEPRVGNAGLARYIDERFNLVDSGDQRGGDNLKYRRVTHVNDPVPLLPLTEWDYAMHAGEIFISKPSLSPDVQDLQHCHGDHDKHGIAGQDSTIPEEGDTPKQRRSFDSFNNRDLLATVQDEISDVVLEPWGIPTRYKLWQLFFAHRDYFWRLGLCEPL